ncbi:MAG: hypothetical protein ACXWLM_07540, partial [Myxococcales bacterium]
MRLALPLILVLALGAAAEETPPDAGPAKSADKVRAVVHLKDGTAVSGTVRRLRLGKSISLSLPSGKSQTFEDAEIVEIELFGAAANPEDGSFPVQAVKANAPKGKPAEAAPPSRAPPLPEPAPVSDLDTVYLADGGLLRGVIETEKPDVVVRLVSGRKRTIAAKDVKSIVRHGAPAAEATDAVYLKDGTVLRGTVESEKPDVVIRLVSGKRR